MGLWRIYDKLEDGSGKVPDGTPIERLMPLKDKLPPPEKDEMHSGYTYFINGKFGERPLQPPLGILTRDRKNKIEPTPLEKANFVTRAPGDLYSQTCPYDSRKNLKIFEITLVQAKLVYNDYGWHGPQGRFFVLKEEIKEHESFKRYTKKVERGEIKVEPLVITCKCRRLYIGRLDKSIAKIYRKNLLPAKNIN